MSRNRGRNRGITGPAGPPSGADEKSRAEYAESMREYRKFLEQCETEATSDFDKTTVTLSGGALALAFLKEVPATIPKWAVVRVLGGALAALVISLIGVLLSLMASRKSMRYELHASTAFGRSRTANRPADGGGARRKRSTGSRSSAASSASASCPHSS